MEKRILRIGLDIGSTTVKIVVLGEDDAVLDSAYQRHRADIRSTVVDVVTTAIDKMTADGIATDETEASVVVTGSGGLSVSLWLKIPFVQEVVASTKAVKKLIPQTDVVIELGGEDAKITYFGRSVEQRMNGTCAGGTGAFIDQMAALLETDPTGLNELARDATTIYPIAARCGVFAKTDVQPLINEGARRADIAASIFQAVVTQTISGLACGKPIRGKIAFLGGPLHFLDQLRRRFIETLKLKDDEIIVPDDGQLFVAAGAAFSADGGVSDAENGENKICSLAALKSAISTIATAEMQEVQRLEPLFENEADLAAFRKRHVEQTAKYGDLAAAKGPVFLGVDAGSTTTKAILLDGEGRILWKFYDVNAGNPVNLAVKVLQDLYRKLPKDAFIARSVSTGYGEALFQAALGVDAGEVETIAHYRAARFFVPDVEFLLDIGGQDMKALRMKDGAITSIQLNEACSSGCGSFLDNFARSLGLSVSDFVQKALLAEKPVDLGSRCTVFMNSRVKQAQKEGASVADISAGLSYSVVKNALFKVIKMRKASDIGSRIVVQGGTFYNDAVLRAFEKIAGVEAFRPDIAGLMGAFGAALIAREQWQKNGDENARSQITAQDELESFQSTVESRRCGKCANNCFLTISTFTSGGKAARGSRSFVTGNRCERGAEIVNAEKAFDAANFRAENLGMELPNLFKWKYSRVFGYHPIPEKDARRGIVGIPRVLNMYENYPLWFTFWTHLGFSVRLSPRSSHKIYEKGMESIPSESVCYPGKIVHGHIVSLLESGCKLIFYPCAPYEKQEDAGAGNHYNCPIVTSYPEVIRNNIGSIRASDDIVFLNPFLPIYDKRRLAQRLVEEISEKLSIPQNEIEATVDAAWAEQEKYRKDCEEAGENALEALIRMGASGVVLAGRPYHVDPEINHGIPEMLVGLGLGVLTEDSVAHLGEIERPLRVIDQWTYHNRLYRAANFVAGTPQLELVQLTSFGCGLDAVTADQVEEILSAKRRMYTLVKIDEGSNTGAVRIRMRSLIAASKERMQIRREELEKQASAAYRRQIFTTEMKATHTILAPNMSPIHFRLLQKAFTLSGYNFEFLPAFESGTAAVDAGLQFVNNDACYPSIITTGQLIAALKSGKYDLNHVSLMMSQTGGGCRATNYIGFIRRALKDAGWGHIPVISLNMVGLEGNPGFKVSFKMLSRAIMSIVLGDLLMRVVYRTRPYEAVEGSVNALHEKWNAKIDKMLERATFRSYNKTIKEIVKDFDEIPLRPVKKPRVGVVGEILVKFHPLANNDIFSTIEKEGAECVVPDLADFFLYGFSNGIFRHKQLAFPKKTEMKGRIGIWFVERYRSVLKRELANSKRFDAPKSIYELAAGVDDIVQLGNIMGEGWFLTAEMVELIESGVPNIACVQPFGCLPNHVTGKGMIKELHRRFPAANIATIDYDPGSSEVNQLNRLKLLLSNAKPGSHPDD